MASERQITAGPGGRLLTNVNVWSSDGQWLVYDTRSDALGDVFDGTRIETVHVATGEVRRLYESTRGANCGVATFHPKRDQVVFILGPEDPTPEWQYGPSHRQGVIVDIAHPGVAVSLDARDLTLTPGALRGGSHVHVFSPDGAWVSFTYDDALLPSPGGQRSVGVGVPLGPVRVKQGHPRSHDGSCFCVLATRTTAHPHPGSDEIRRAFEEGWIGTRGYTRPDGARQGRALAFQGEVLTADGTAISEAFVVDLPDDVSVASPDGPLEGTLSTRPFPPLGTHQRRLTRTEGGPYPGLQGPRHWLRASPDGAQIAFLMRDEGGVAQLWSISPSGGEPRRITHDAWGVASAFTWSPDGRLVAYAADNSVFVVEAATGQSRRLTARTEDADAPSPLACVFSPDGVRIAYLRRLADTSDAQGPRSNQIFVASLGEEDGAVERLGRGTL